MEAVLHRDGPMLVTAGPGSGKTHVVTTRLLHMILAHHIPPEKILVITFTKEAARSMSSRFQAIFDQSSLSEQISFGTFHSIYYQIIRSIPEYSRIRLIFEKEKKYFLSQAVQGLTEDRTEELLSAVSFYKNTLQLTKASEKVHMEPAEFAEIIKKYDALKWERQCMDFDDMLYQCLQLLKENKKLLHTWRNKFTYFLIDEFQDCNPVQYQILKMLAGNNLFVVGDDDQAIYGFRGADALILQRFLKDYPTAKKVILGINYRCADSIVKASAKVIEENTLRLSKTLHAYRDHSPEENVNIRKWAHKDEMHAFFGKYFQEIPKEDLLKHAVLFRTNQDAQMFGVSLLKYNIPFQMKEKSESIYDHFLVKDIMAFFQAAYGNRDRKIFLRIINKCGTYIGRESLHQEQVDLKQVKEFYTMPYMNNPDAVAEIESLEKHLKCLRKMSICLGIRYIRMAMGYERYLVKRAADNPGLFRIWQELLTWLQEDSQKFHSLQEWEEYQIMYEKKLQNKEKDVQGVQLMTMHSSKGLEFDHCYILNVNEGTIPRYQLGQKLTKEQLEEERRIFYVGMTRAKLTLELHYLTGTKERPKFPSRYIAKLIK